MRNAFLVVVASLIGVTATSVVRAQAAIVLDSNDTRLGVYAGPANAGDRGREGFLVISTTGYAAIFDDVTGEHASPRAGHVDRQLGPVRFAGPNCTGAIFVEVATVSTSISIVGGFVFRSNAIVYYAARGAVSAQVTTQSEFDRSGNCVDANATSELMQVAPNDPAISGFSSSGYFGPLRLGFLARDLFSDSFETA